ncbi:PREDICTED: lanC-like protein 1 [Ceratosolen solmsi marchali]|uniref:LanC-like protein 1 n=1 Tax=Ceratosolen solmsi marchali TaxID=326594 RepID=A0AAJ7DUG1_9HYME|nr:PREDICTED: lanC-like protein 1 [Ceratosolen solmsi marchali]
MNIIQCNIAVTTNMCQIILPQMVSRHKGVIVNIASSAAVIPSPLLTVYAATKAYILKFSTDLHRKKMSVRYLNNPYEDYVEGNRISILDSNNLNISDEFKGILNAGTKVLLKKLEANKKNWYYLDDYSLYTGISGISYTFYHYGKYFKDQNYISIAQQILDSTVKNLREKRRVTFLTGYAGPLALGAIIHHLQMHEHESKKMISKLISQAMYAIEDYSASDLPDELLYGRVGCLYALLFVNKYINPPPIEENIIKNIINEILRSGIKYNKHEHDTPPLRYTWHDTEYLGGAHGVAGILYVLLQARNYLSEEQIKTKIEPTLQWLESIKYSSGNFPSSIESTTDKLVHWCHGAPSMTMLFCLAYEIFNKEQYLRTALECGEVVWKRGLLKKGCGMCHGVAGNAYTFLSLFQLTKEPKYLYRACKFAEWCLDYERNQTRHPDRPFSLFEGLAGAIYFLIDMQKPLEAKFPGYTL